MSLYLFLFFLMNQKIIVGVVGLSGAGKNTVAEDIFPQRYGADYISLTEKVKDYIRSLGKENSTRADRINYANELRQQEGNGVFMQHAFSDIEQSTNKIIVINDVYHPDEIGVLQKAFSQSTIYILGVVADEDVRFARMLKRNRPGDPSTLKEFQKNDALNRGGNGKSFGQKLDECLQKADFMLDNSHTLEELYKQTDEIYQSMTL